MSAVPYIPVVSAGHPGGRSRRADRWWTAGLLGAVLAILPIIPARSAPPTATGPDSSLSQLIAANSVVLATGEISAQQKALKVLGTLPGLEVDKVLLAQFDRFRAGELSPALWLELFDAAALRDNPELKARLTERARNVAASHDPLSPYRECLEGGDAAAGREIFTKRPEAGCIRCHSVNGEGGQIGPDLTALHQATDRVYILESIIDPNAVIAPGFQNVLLTLKSGESVSGILSFESDEEIVITSVVDGKKRTIQTAEITERTSLPSAMPPGFGLVLGKRAIRDLVEFIASRE